MATITKNHKSSLKGGTIQEKCLFQKYVVVYILWRTESFVCDFDSHLAGFEWSVVTINAFIYYRIMFWWIRRNYYPQLNNNFTWYNIRKSFCGEFYNAIQLSYYLSRYEMTLIYTNETSICKDASPRRGHRTRSISDANCYKTHSDFGHVTLLNYLVATIVFYF